MCFFFIVIYILFAVATEKPEHYANLLLKIIISKLKIKYTLYKYITFFVLL